ncbi:RNA-binding cell elongation regulator Jag/EloR [Desulfothermus sp.]
METKKIFEGKNLESAIEKACEYFKKDKNELEIKVIEEGSSGIFGIGGRKAKIEASIKYDVKKLENMVKEMVDHIISYITPSSEIDVTIEQKNINVSIADSPNSGLIIGKEGQTISALEYILNKMVSKKWPDKVYVHLDAAGYKERQENNLKKQAMELAKRAKTIGRPFSTRPLSSYHRRVVHMALKHDKDIITQSRGEGPLKRVQIAPRKRLRRKTG